MTSEATQNQPPATPTGEITNGESANVEQTPAAKPKADPKEFYLRRKLGRAESRLHQTTTENIELRARLDAIEQRLSAPPVKPGESPPAAPQRQSERPLTRDDVQTQAAEIASVERFNERTDSMMKAGKALPDFEEALAGLREVADFDTSSIEGVRQFKESFEPIVEAENSHKILHYLGTHPEEAAEYFDMTPRQQARYVGRLEAKFELGQQPSGEEGNEEGQPAAKPSAPVSKAPPPARPVGTRGPANTSTVPSDKDDVSTWMRKRREQVKARREGRR